MERQGIKWHIWVDTGGTFTDCIATSPEGVMQRIKILSSSCLRGKLGERINSKIFQFSNNWPIREDIFAGYYFKIIGKEYTNLKVEKIDFFSRLIQLNEDFDFNKEPVFDKGLSFEITANEEAPILAARIATKTPLNQPFPEIDMRLGTTKGTNALLERKGAKTAFLVTKGFRDLIYIGTQQRPHLFQLNIPEPTLIYEEVFEVEERLNAKGEILQKLEADTIQNLIIRLRKTQIEVVAITLMHAYLNPIHEQQLKEALINAGFNFISVSHELTPSIKILPRAKTALVNAYLHPIIQGYLQNVRLALVSTNLSNFNLPKQKNKLKPEESGQTKATVTVMTSSGGLVDSQNFTPKDSLLSGPAGGVVGAAKIAQSLGINKILTLDMGGTSTDCARFDGAFDYDFLTVIDNIEMLSPCLSIETVAAGGGSICYFDGYKLCVGPESAGANPGPACYGAGGPLTITDVNLLLEKLTPDMMGIPIDSEAAKKALAEINDAIQQKTGERYADKDLLYGFEKIANEKMADAIRKISVAKGFDPKDYALLVFGGAGGLHACKIADLLDVSRVILPYDGGILSAYGIGHSNVEKLGERQILKDLEEVKGQIPDIFNEIKKMLYQEFQKEDLNDIAGDLFFKSAEMFLRFKGQNNTIGMDLFIDEAEIDRAFREKYELQFGHKPANSEIELESVKILMAHGFQPHLSKKRILENPRMVSMEKKIHWDKLENGDYTTASFILMNQTSTAFIEEGWETQVLEDKNVVLSRLINKANESDAEKASDSGEVSDSEKEAINLELFTNRFSAIAEEMGLQLQRTSFSVNIKERLDFSCAILDADAELLVNAPHIPVHLGSLGICARLVKEKITLGKGDVVITNHPKYGGSHLPDVTLMSAVFSEEDKLIGYVINRAHHAEIGGKRPGSMPPDATRLEEEGVAILPMYLARYGEVRWERLEEILIGSPYPTRSIHENLADINAALASLKTGAEKLKSLVSTHGLEKVHHYMKLLKRHSFEALQDSLQLIGNKSFIANEQLDDGHQIQVKITVQEVPPKFAPSSNSEIKIVFDFTNTSSTHPNNLNANISIVYSAIIYVLRLLCKKEIPLNEGLMQNVDIILPDATFLNPIFSDNPRECPAVVGGNTEVSQRLVDTLLKAFGLAACSQGTMNNFLFGNEKFGYYETIGGGTGAGDGFHGRSAVHQHMTNTKITDPEEMELRYPVLLQQFSIRENSGGNGKWKGGNGIIRAVEFLEEIDLTIISQHRKENPYGLEDGESGKIGQQKIIRADGTIEYLKGVDSRKMQKGDRILIETPGGGGYGET